ncbi:FmdB family zinc ribbon protein [Rhodohalobacter sp. 8-1]|uniref:FmdB family zinc ribbon protein n=1 Tax=Rhodohalobacter sp. 8-1 TaxID=3131972 RepID=UPI0030EC7CA5
MPTYEYKREDGTTFEVLQSMSEEPLKVCPTTGQPVKRLISGGTGLLFKGSGFYVTDYKNGKSNGKGKNNESSSKTDSPESKSASTDKKEPKSGPDKPTD